MRRHEHGDQPLRADQVDPDDGGEASGQGSMAESGRTGRRPRRRRRCRPTAARARLTKASIDAGSARSSAHGVGLAPAGADLAGDLLGTARCAGPRAPPGGRAAASVRAVARPMPDEAPVTMAGRRSGWAMIGSWWAGVSVDRHRGGQGGEAADVDRVDPLALRTRRCRSRRPAVTSSSSPTRASSRARAAPRQKWRPLPKLTSFEVSRSMS